MDPSLIIQQRFTKGLKNPTPIEKYMLGCTFFGTYLAASNLMLAIRTTVILEMLGRLAIKSFPSTSISVSNSQRQLPPPLYVSKRFISLMGLANPGA